MDDEISALRVAVATLETKDAARERTLAVQGRALEQMKAALNRSLGGLAAVLVVVNLLFAAWARWPAP